MKKTICCDLDDTIAKTNLFPALDEPYEDARESLLELKKMGYRIKLYTCRLSKDIVPQKNMAQQLKLIEEYIEKHNLPIDEIIVDLHKPFADFYIDDRNIEFRGNWRDVVNKVKKRGSQ